MSDQLDPVILAALTAYREARREMIYSTWAHDDLTAEHAAAGRRRTAACVAAGDALRSLHAAFDAALS